MEIQVNHLYKSYGGVPVLRDVTFTAGPGVTCVMAPSGAGKTTLLHILLGMESGDSGTITGRDCRWAAVFQENRLLEINFQNARCTEDTNLNKYVNKKKSSGKVDMVVALINAICLLLEDLFYDDFVVQTA